MTEWLVEVKDGRVLLPPTRDRATHYRITVSNYTGTIELTPVSLLTDQDVARHRPLGGDEPALNRVVYDEDEWASLQYPCPTCAQPKDRGCVTAQSRHPLEPKDQNKAYHVRCVHKSRIALMTGSTS